MKVEIEVLREQAPKAVFATFLLLKPEWQERAQQAAAEGMEAFERAVGEAVLSGGRK